MADLTPEEIALGIRAVRAGWMWEAGDVVRDAHHVARYPGDDDAPIFAGRWRLLAAIDTDSVHLYCCGRLQDLPRKYGAAPISDSVLADGYGWVIPDPTARGFVSAALAQVRARTDRWWVCRALWDGARWRVEDSRGDPIHHGDYPSEAEAVVAALEATKP